MGNNKYAFRAGVLAGAAAGAFWVVAKQRWLGDESDLMDWDRVQGIALRTAGNGIDDALWTSAQIRAEYVEMVRRLEEPIAAYTGSSILTSNIDVSVMGRREWIKANVNNFTLLFDPIEDVYREVGRQTAVVIPGLAQLGQLAVSSQIGLLLGYLSRRVLGQYDMSVLGREPLTNGKLYFVHQNIAGIEAELRIPGDEFRRWITLHESTHAHEFEAFPWVRDYMNHTLRAYLECILQDVRTASHRGGTGPATIARMADNLRNGRSLLESVMSPRQRQYMEQLQALMCLLEGYSNHVMNAVGKQVMPHFNEIKQQVESRSRERSQAEKLFLKLTGLAMKMEQYRLGEQFVDRVVEARGIAFANRVWDGPENLPTMPEILRPDRWVSRMETVV